MTSDPRRARILDPTGRSTSGATSPRAARLRTLEGTTLGLLDNGKPNASVLLDGVADGLRERFSLREVLRFHKPSAGTPVEQTQMEEILATCDFAVVAVGD